MSREDSRPRDILACPVYRYRDGGRGLLSVSSFLKFFTEVLKEFSVSKFSRPFVLLYVNSEINNQTISEEIL